MDYFRAKLKEPTKDGEGYPGTGNSRKPLLLFALKGARGGNGVIAGQERWSCEGQAISGAMDVKTHRTTGEVGGARE